MCHICFDENLHKKVNQVFALDNYNATYCSPVEFNESPFTSVYQLYENITLDEALKSQFAKVSTKFYTTGDGF